jgi:hypothetical protein
MSAGSTTPLDLRELTLVISDKPDVERDAVAGCDPAAAARCIARATHP